jgi:peroxiredoxin
MLTCCPTLNFPAQSGDQGQAGQVAPDLSLPTLGGSTFSLASQRGKPTVLFFFADTCGSCVPGAQALSKVQHEYGPKVSIVAVNLNPSATPQDTEQFKQSAGDGAFTWVLDPEQTAARAYQVTLLDTAVIIDRTGRIAYRDQFSTSYQTLKDELQKLLP